MTEVSENLFFSVTQLAFICKLTNFMFQGKKLLKLEDMLNQNGIHHFSFQEEEVMLNLIRTGRRQAKIYRMLCILVVIFYGLYPFFDKNSDGNMKLPIPMSFPFNPNNYYPEIYFMSILSVGIGAWINSSIDILTIMLIIIGTCQLEILKYKLENILPENGKPDEIIGRKLKQCVEDLNDIYRLVF